MDADRPLAGRTMDQLYGMAGPPQGEEQAPLCPQGRAEVSYPSMDRKFCSEWTMDETKGYYGA